jgi:hypothetical protein
VIPDHEEISPELYGHIHDRGGHVTAALLEPGFDTDGSGPIRRTAQHIVVADM